MAHVTRVWFIGVSTGQSAIHRLLPAWSELLGVEASIVGRDLPRDSPPSAYREILDQLVVDDSAVGAVVTSHKVAMLAAARDRFSSIDPTAQLLGEVSSVRRAPAGLEGFARDATAIRRTLDESLDPGHWDGDAEVLCFGVGGSCRALLLALMTESEAPSPLRLRASAPRVFHAVGRNAGRLVELRSISRAAGIPDERVRLHEAASVAENDDLVARLPAGSLIVNATGLGKDAPGSPLSAAARIPAGAIAWDFNYRGDLRFLDAAAATAAEGVRILDGWLYFLHGWTEALAPLFGRTLDRGTFARLAEASEPFRPEASRARQHLVHPGPPDP